MVDLDVDGNAQRLIRSLDVIFVDMSMAVMGGEGEGGSPWNEGG